MADLQAAREALARCEWPEALVCAAGPTEDPDLLDAAAEAHWWLGSLDDCIEARELAFRQYEHAGDLVAAGRVAVRLWEHHLMKLRPSIAGAWLRRARGALEGQPECVELGALVLREVEIAHGSGELTTAAAKAREVRTMARRLGSADLEAESLQALGRVLIDAGDLDEGLGTLDEAMLSALEGRLTAYSTGKVLCSMISACEQLGDLSRAAEWTDATLRWSAKHPLAMWPGICRVHHASILQHRGEWAAAEREALRACEEMDGFHLPNVAAAWIEVGEVRRRLGDLTGAGEAFARAEALTGQQCAGLAMLWLAQGRVAAAGDLITRLLDAQPWNVLARGRLLPAYAQIALAAGDLDTAETAITELEGIARDHHSPLLGACSLTARGRLQLARAECPLARTTLRHALERWHELEVPYEIATTRLLLAQAFRACGDDDEAARSLELSAQIFDRLGVMSGGDTLPAGLTAREAEVLVLVAEGCTNKHVADTLFLSERTVARHLSNIFAKTGATSRTAAATFAHTHGLPQKKGSHPSSGRA